MLVKILEIDSLLKDDNILLEKMKEVLKEKNSEQINQIRTELLERIDEKSK